jgi:hypothetical protein
MLCKLAAKSQEKQQSQSVGGGCTRWLALDLRLYHEKLA